jgi:hypothetical protein
MQVNTSRDVGPQHDGLQPSAESPAVFPDSQVANPAIPNPKTAIHNPQCLNPSIPQLPTLHLSLPSHMGLDQAR